MKIKGIEKSADRLALASAFAQSPACARADVSEALRVGILLLYIALKGAEEGKGG